jgi:hypothetical protein
MDVVLHRAPDKLEDVEEVLLETLALGTHVNCSSIHYLVEHLQLYL